MENMITKEGANEDILVEMCGGQMSRAVMNVHQYIDLQSVIVEDLSCKMNIKRSRKRDKLNHSAVFSMDTIVCNVNPEDIQLGLHILQNNILKAKIEICKILVLITAH